MLAQKTTALIFAGLLLATPALALHDTTQPETENVKERLTETAPEKTARRPLSLELGTTRFTLTGLIEAEASFIHPEGGDKADEARLSTVQLGLEAELTPWLDSHVIGLWEKENTEPAEIDEAVLVLKTPGSVAGQTLSLTGGRQYLPFGRFESQMISDPLTLELGETRGTSAVVVAEGDLWSARAGAFQGKVDKDHTNGIDTWVAAVELAPLEGLSLGVSYLSDLAESDAELVQDKALYNDEVPAVAAFVALSHGAFGLSVEYLAATTTFADDEVETGEDLTGRRPKAWFIEAGWAATDRLALATRYEEADDYQGDVRRLGATAAYGLCDYTQFAVEYLYADTPADSPAHTFTAQFVIEF